MAFSTKIQIINAKVEQQSGGTLTLSGDTTVADSGSLKYFSHPTFVADEEIVDKKYVDDNVVSGSTYNLDSPSTVDVGGLTAGSILTGLTSNEILEDILVPFLEPTFSSFSANQTQTVEIGTTISGTRNFSWAFTDAGNVQDNTLDIYDVTAASPILSNTGTTSPANGVGVTSITFDQYGDTQIWRGQADDTQALEFISSNYTVTGYFPYYWGVVTRPGAAGDNRPTISSDFVLSGSSNLASSDGTVSIVFGAGASDHIWVAIPDDADLKGTWWASDFDNGDIFGAATTGPSDLGPNRFPTPELQGVTNGTWGDSSPATFKVYLSNWQGAATTVEFRV